MDEKEKNLSSQVHSSRAPRHGLGQGGEPLCAFLCSSHGQEREPLYQARLHLFVLSLCISILVENKDNMYRILQNGEQEYCYLIKANFELLQK
jgi:hypothetical protein